jgi:methyl-accepting chemotaxis protein
MDSGQRTRSGVSMRFRLGLVLIALGAMLIAATMTSLIFSDRQRVGLAETQERMQTLSDVLLPLRSVSRDLQVDVIQVQQFLSDASATHHDDSFGDAAKYAADFGKQSKTLKALLSRLPQDHDVAGIVEKVQALDTQFQAYNERA